MTVARRENLVVIGTGMIGSGKSRLLADRYASRHPRVVHLDDNDEICERIRHAVRVVGVSALFDALDGAARRGVRRFNIAAVGLEPGDITALLGVLAPRAETGVSLTSAFGTLGLEWGEAGALCMQDSALATALSATIMRSRHCGLSLFLATQYPYALPPVTRTNAHEIFFFQQDDPQALVWARQVTGAWGAEYVAALKDHAFLLYVRQSQMLYLCDSQRRVVDSIAKHAAPAALTKAATTHALRSGAPRSERAPRS